MARIAAAALATAALAVSAGSAQASTIPVFDVGTSVVDISPTTPQFLGGYDQMAKGTDNVHDPLQVRAFFVGHGKNAVAFAIVDTQGWFAGYQEGPYGVTDARQAAATELDGLGYDVGPQDLIVSSTHSHAAPTIMGIWGPTDPAYLQRVHDATVTAIAEAARHTRPAQLWTADGSIADIIAHNIEGTDHFDGWGIDASTPALWARDPKTGATEGLYVNVPVHADQFRGSKYDQISADHPGAERAILDHLLGGTAVVAMGTLGRQETMGGEDDYPEVARQGRFIANGILRGLAHARPITSTALGGAEQYIAVPAHNAALLALLALNATGPNCGNPTGDCAIDRSLEPPYLAGNVIGTWVTGLRIGDVAWVSEPGEAFNEVSQAVRAAVGGARQVNVVGMAQDQLGYYYPPEDYPASELNPSDYILFNVSPSLADESVDASAVVATELGFNGQPSHPMMDDENPQAFFHAGTQFYPSVVESADPQRDFLVGDATSQAPGAPTQPAHTATPAVIDFGDGTPAVTISGDEQRISHTFPGPGRYSVTSTTTDETGYERSYTAWVIVDRTPQAIVRRVVRGGRALYTAAVRGGDGHALAAHWTFADGGGADGLTVTRPAGAPAPAVTVVDGAGDTASG